MVSILIVKGNVVKAYHGGRMRATKVQEATQTPSLVAECHNPLCVFLEGGNKTSTNKVGSCSTIELKASNNIPELLTTKGKLQR